MKFIKFKPSAHAVLTFKRWGRKSYSAFSTLHRAVVVSVLLVVYLLATPVLSFATEQDTMDVKMQYDLDEIEVSAQRSPAMYSQVARIISVIERKEIEAVPVQNVQDLLEYVAGVDVRQRGAEGVQADVSVRGGTFDQTLILLNGINITDPQTGHHNLNLPISLAQVERIEILEGPAARVYGPNAFSGAINIVTIQKSNSSVYAALTGGSYGYLDGDLSATFSTGEVQHTLAFNGKHSDGYIDNTDFEGLNGFYSNHFKTEKGSLSFQLGASEKGFGANSFYTPKFPNQYEETRTLFTSLKWQGNSPMHWTPVVYYRRHQDRFELFREDPASWYTTHNYHLTNVYGANLNSWFKWAAGKTAFGVEYRSENIKSNVLGEELDEPEDVPGEEAQFTKGDGRDILSVFIEHAAYINNWTLTAGVMSNRISDSDLGVNFFPGIDISYDLTQSMKLYSSYNTSLRMPTFTDLYYDGPTNIGNPHLEPEKSATLEGGLKVNGKFIKGHAVVFYRHGTNIIDWVKTEASEVWQPQNLTEINNLGTEVQINFLLKERYNRNYPNINLKYLYNKLSKEEADFVSNYALDNLRHKLVASVHQKIAKSFTLNLQFVYQDREGSYTKFDNQQLVGEVEYEPFWVCDLKLAYNKKRWSAFVSANNVFDTEYNDIGNVIQPGIWTKAGLAYRLDFNSF